MEDPQEAEGLRSPGHVLTAFKLVAVDLDGTLLDTRGRVHRADREAVEALAAVGVATTIVTGRLYSGTRHVADEIGVRGLLGCADGSHVVDHDTGANVLHATLTGERAARVRDVLAASGAVTFAFAHDQVVHDAAGEPLLPYVRTWSRELVRAERVTDNPHWDHELGVKAAIAVGTAGVVERAHASIVGALGDAAFVVAFQVRNSPGTWAMLVRAGGHTKGTALERIARARGIAPSEVVAIGDWHNDLPMFAVAGRSFAMGQAPEDVKSAATDRLRAHVGSGGAVAEAARRVGLL